MLFLPPAPQPRGLQQHQHRPHHPSHHPSERWQAHEQRSCPSHHVPWPACDGWQGHNRSSISCDARSTFKFNALEKTKREVENQPFVWMMIQPKLESMDTKGLRCFILGWSVETHRHTTLSRQGKLWFESKSAVAAGARLPIGRQPYPRRRDHT